MSHRVISGHQFLPPMGYYNQPSPGAPRPEGAKAPQEHLADLEQRREGVASLSATEDGHELRLHHPGDGTSHMRWQGHQMSEDYRPGEIRDIHSAEKGDAAAMHDAARAIAADNPHIAAPKHSPFRTDEGEGWVRKEQQRHGEAVWGTPPVGTPEHAEWSKLTDRTFNQRVGLAA